MIFKIDKFIHFDQYNKIFNFISLVLIVISIITLIFKGLNYGVDFKGGTLIELRVQNEGISISQIRNSFRKLQVGDINVKEFGKKK